MILPALLALLGADEAALREAFETAIRAAEPARRVEAVRKLSRANEEKTILLLAGHLKDAAKEVRLAIAAALEGATDGAGAAVKPLSAVLVDKKEEPEVRLACAKALSKSKYRHDPIHAMIQAISNITEFERHLFQFGADVTDLLNKVAGDDFGKTKQTPGLWEQWWEDNKAKLEKEDAARLREYRKSQGK
jgi:HEAT repeat protein